MILSGLKEFVSVIFQEIHLGYFIPYLEMVISPSDYPMIRFLIILFLGIGPICISIDTNATINTRLYDSLPIPINEHWVKMSVNDSLQSWIQQSFFFKKDFDTENLSPARIFDNRTWDFYFLLGLVFFLGIIRFFDPNYINELLQANFNAGLGSRYKKEKIERAFYPNLFMNIFFTISLAAYFFYILQNFTTVKLAKNNSLMLMVILVSGIALIYLVKYFAIRFSGWALNMQGITDNYLFNVFLVNKMLAIIILPITIFLAFPNPIWSSYLLMVSLILIAASFIVRYIQSWKVSSASFKLSKFHFFTYLCASEILPLAVLIKFVWTKILL